MSGSEKKVSENTYDISSINRVTKKFVEVSRCSRAKQRQRNVQKKMCCTSKVAFLLIRPIVVFHRSPALPSQLSITRVYIFFEQTISMRNKKQDMHVKCSNGSFSQPRGIFHVSILIYLFRYLQSANLVCVVSYGCVYHAIKQSCSYDTNN